MRSRVDAIDGSKVYFVSYLDISVLHNKTPNLFFAIKLKKEKESLGQRINSAVYVKVPCEPMNFALGISSSKEIGDRTRQRKKILAGIEH